MKLAVFFLLTALSCSGGSIAAEASLLPVITPALQAARDDDRRLILEEERQTERKALAGAESALATAGPDADKEVLSKTVQRHAKNLAALDAEIARMGGNEKGGSDRSAPVGLKAASAAKVTAATPAKDVPYWDVYRREQAWRQK